MDQACTDDYDRGEQLNIAANIKTFVDAQITDLYATLTISKFADDSSALSLRCDPSPAAETEFIDGSFTGQQQVAFYARNLSDEVAITTLNKILAIFNQPTITLDDALCISVLPLSTVSYVETLSTGESVYTCSVTVKYDGENSIE